MNTHVPWQAFSAMDGYLVVAIRQENLWKRLCEALEQPGLADDPRFKTNAGRLKHRDQLIRMLEDVFRTRSVTDWLERLRACEVPAGPVNHLDHAFAEPSVVEREMIVEYDHPDVGRVRLPGNPIKLSGVTKTISTPAPRLGEHTDEVLRRVLSLSTDRIAALRKQRAIG